MKNVFKVLILTLLIASCKMDKTEKEYTWIKQSGIQGEELLSKLSVFEIEHSAHFASKVDLGSYYLLVGNLPQASHYLARAESVLEKVANTKDNRKNKTILWGSIAYIQFIEKNYKDALDYVDKSIKADKEAGKEYILLKAHILYAMGNMDKSLSLFDSQLKESRDIFTAEDLRAYMYLLAEKERFSEAVSILERYSEFGEYYIGFGLFASNMYEKVLDQKHSILFAYLEYEYSRAGDASKDSLFLVQLETLVKKLDPERKNKEIIDTLSLVKSRFDEKVLYSRLKDKDGFIEKYIKISNQIRDQTVLPETLDLFLSLEKYFKYFPNYYISVWHAVDLLEPSSLPEYKNALEKSLYLDSKESYSKFIKQELGRIIGLTDSESKNILLTFEIQSLIKSYIQTPEWSKMQPIINLLNIPDCSYVFSAISLLKAYPVIYIALQQYASSHKDKASERIRFILER